MNPLLKTIAICILLLQGVSSFFIVEKQQNSNNIYNTPQKGNITNEEQTAIKKAISIGEQDFNSTNFNQIAKNISLSLKVTLNSYRWSVFVFDKGVQQTAVSTGHMTNHKYISVINFGKFNLSYQIYGTNSGYGCTETGGGGSAQFGEDISSDKQQKILETINSSIVYRGENIESAVEYIANKTDSFVFNGSFTVIANPTTAFGFYICRYKEYWASLRAYGDFKWNYYLSFF